MSGTESLPYGESKSPPVGETGHEHRLHRGALGIMDISAATMANIGPAMSFYFGFGFLAITAGVASPLTIVAAGIAIALLGNTLAQFSRAQPSTGGFITFVGKTFGGTSAVTTALLCGVGYIIAMASVIAISGGFLSITLQRYAHVDIPWGYLTVILTALAVLMMIRGVGLSTKIAGFFFAFEMLVLVVVSVASLIKNGGHLSAVPFEPSHITNGFSGLAAGFPLAIYLFIGWENSAALAEETDNPRRNVPRAVFTSVAIMAVSYVVFAYATVSGFGYNVTKLGAAPIPFISVADATIGVLAFFAYLAGMTSTLGALIAGTNSQARLVFNAGREGLLPGWIGHVNAGPAYPDERHLHVRGDLRAHHRRLGLPAPDRRHHRITRPDHVLRRVVHDGHHPGTGRVPAGQPGSAVLLPEVPAAGVQPGQARHPAGTGSPRDHRAAVLPGQAGPAHPVRLVPVRGPHRGRGGRHLRVHPQFAQSRPGRPGGLDRGRRIAPRRLF